MSLQVKDEGSGYQYNAVHRWYYDTTSGMYYGGETPTWTKVPDLPEDAKYEAMAAPSSAQGKLPHYCCWPCCCMNMHPCSKSLESRHRLPAAGFVWVEFQ